MDTVAATQSTTTPVTIFDDLAIILKDRGLTDKEVEEIMVKVATEVEIEVIEELMSTMGDEKKEKLKELSKQQTDFETVIQELGLKIEEVQEIESRKLAEVFDSIVPSLNI